MAICGEKNALYRDLGRRLEIEREKMNNEAVGKNGELVLCETDHTKNCDELAARIRELEKDIFDIK